MIIFHVPILEQNNTTEKLMEQNNMTAVEWLQIKMATSPTQEMVENINVWFKEAKQMEKEQKEECWNVAHQSGRFEGKGIAEENWQTFKQYYNETYGNESV